MIDHSPLAYPFPIDPSDMQLCAQWAPEGWDNCSEYEKAKQLTARIAEKAALLFYRSLGCEVQDVALSQITGPGEDWKHFDILADDRLVDVK